jgi:putative phosphonate catabolism associated alcohol dehydrogenase
MHTAKPRTAIAAVYDAPNTPFVLRQFPLRPVKRGEVLVRVTMSTICRSDIHSYEGRRPNPCPGILGHEIIGRIEDIGDAIDTDMRGHPLKVGDRITWSEYFFDGQCYYREVLDMPQKCQGVRKYGHDLATEDPHFLGGFAEYCYILPGTWILKLPPELSDEEATPLNCGVAQPNFGGFRHRRHGGDAVVIQGLGLLGLYGAAMAKARDARCVIGLDAVGSRLAVAKKFGADHVVDVSRAPAQSIVDRVRTLCPPDGADAVIEVCGIPDVIPQGLQMLRVGGRYVLVVNPDANVTIDANMLVKRWITMRGIHNYHPRHLIQALDFVVANRERFPFKEIVDAKFALKDLDAAFKKASERSVLRAAIVP